MIEILWNLWDRKSQWSDIETGVEPKHAHVDITLYYATDETLIFVYRHNCDLFYLEFTIKKTKLFITTDDTYPEERKPDNYNPREINTKLNFPLNLSTQISILTVNWKIGITF